MGTVDTTSHAQCAASFCVVRRFPFPQVLHDGERHVTLMTMEKKIQIHERLRNDLLFCCFFSFVFSFFVVFLFCFPMGSVVCALGFTVRPPPM